MATVVHEIEHTYDPGTDVEIPDLTRLPGVCDVEARPAVAMEAVYFDTVTLALTRARVSLRRREGGDDQGWHLKVPAGQGRDEVHLPLSRARRVPPKQLRTSVVAWTLGEELVPVAVVRSRRTPHLLHGRGDTVLAELTDDHIDAEVLVRAPVGHGDPERVVSWHEWELELRHGDPALLADADRLMRQAGAPPATLDRKIARVLAGLLEVPARSAKPRPKRPAHLVLQARLAEQVSELRLRDCEVRRDAADGVHRARVAIRRLRSLLRTFRTLADAGVTEPIREELRWAGRVLGDARDAEVVHETLRRVVDAERRALVLGPVRRRLDRELRGAHDRHRAAAREAMESDRYLGLLASLDRLLADPPWTADAGAAAREVLPPLLSKEFKRLRKRVAAADDAEDPNARDAALHEVRKAAKRMRYAAETLTPAFGPPAKRLAKRVKQVQSELGDHHDTVVARSVALDLGESARRAGEHSFTYGRVHAHLQARAAGLDDAFHDAWGRASRKKHRSWLT